MIAALAGFVLGLAGSWHCVAMCGPLVMLANPRSSTSSGSLVTHTTLYHAGRLSTYLVLGAVATLVGAATTNVGLGRPLTILAGTWLVASALGMARFVPRRVKSTFVTTHTVRALQATADWKRRHALAGPLTFGALNGLLPCGLLYMAMAAAVGMGSIRDGLSFILGFGLGTIPLLSVVGVSARALAGLLPSRLRRLGPIAIGLVGLLLIGRGFMNPANHVMSAPMSAAGMTHGE